MRGVSLFIFIILVFCRVSSAQALTVESIRYGLHGGKTRIVIDFDQAPDFRAFLIDGPPRLAVDVPMASWKTMTARLGGDGAVRAYRSGPLAKDGLTRIVFDLATLSIVENAFVLPADSTAKDRVVVDLAPASRNLFKARLSDIAGTRGLKGLPSRPAPALSSASMLREASVNSIALPGRKPAPPAREQQRQYVVVLDAGHGGGDPGAEAPGAREKNITLAIARELRRQLEETGRYKVVLTRDRDIYIPLRGRLAISRKAGGDLFISIHADKISRAGVRGASIYTLSETASDAETESLADSENKAGVVAGVDLAAESEDVADILLDLAMREKMNESGLLARMMVNAFYGNNVRLLPNSHRSAGFAVLKAPDVPAVLIETGFLSNREEAKLLNSPDFQRKIAGAMREGVDAYFRKMEALRRER
jgi:N-acetylmuramoyl-L-alanine amidase